MPAETEDSEEERIQSLINSGQYKEAAKIARILCQKHPDDFEAHLLLAVSLTNQEKHEKARRALVTALEIFPNHWQLRMMLGHTYGHLGDWRRAEEAYRRALRDAEEAHPEEVAELHCSVAEALWAQQIREEALAEWRKALEVDPKCEEAQESLKECTNEYGEPKAPNLVFDDLYHFQHIHTQRYFSLVGRGKFVSKEEADAVVGILMMGWNELVAPRSREIENMKTEGKSDLFGSVTLDFSECVRKWKKE